MPERTRSAPLAPEGLRSLDTREARWARGVGRGAPRTLDQSRRTPGAGSCAPAIVVRLRRDGSVYRGKPLEDCDCRPDRRKSCRVLARFTQVRRIEQNFRNLGSGSENSVRTARRHGLDRVPDICHSDEITQGTHIGCRKSVGMDARRGQHTRAGRGWRHAETLEKFWVPRRSDFSAG